MYCLQTNCLQSKLSKISVGIDGNSSYTEIEKPQYPARLDIYEKDNEILYCIKEKKLLEDEFAAFKLLVDQERNNWQIHDEHKLMAFASLEINLKVNPLNVSSRFSVVCNVFCTAVHPESSSCVVPRLYHLNRSTNMYDQLRLISKLTA